MFPQQITEEAGEQKTDDGVKSDDDSKSKWSPAERTRNLHLACNKKGNSAVPITSDRVFWGDSVLSYRQHGAHESEIISKAKLPIHPLAAFSQQGIL